MDTTTFIWTIASTISSGFQVFAGKVVAHEKRDSAFNGIFTYGVGCAVGLAFLLFQNDWGGFWTGASYFGLAAGAIHAAGNFYRIEALKYIDSVIYFPLNKILGPILVVVAGVLIFSEALTMRQYIGIGLSLTVPLLLVSSGEKHRQNDLRKGIILLVVSTVLTVVSLLFLKEALKEGLTVLLSVVLAQSAGVVVSVSFYRYTNSFLSFSHMTARDLKLGMFAGGLGFISVFTMTKALSLGYVSLVYVIHAHYILIPIVLAVWMHKDHINARKLAAIVVSSCAIILLYSA